MKKESIESLIKRGREAQRFGAIRLTIGSIIDELCDAVERLNRGRQNGGRSKSEAKQEAARVNGKKGGRPPQYGLSNLKVAGSNPARKDSLDGESAR